jgi:hypothetical protein
MDHYIHNAEDVDLTGQDIRTKTNNGVLPMSYSELAKYQTIDQLFQRSNYICLLYETRSNYGHWVLISKLSENTVEFFDPYGLSVDQELKYVPDNYRKELNEDIPHLTLLLRGYKVVSSNSKLQKFKENVNTCGRHCVMRYKLRKMTLHHYIGFMMNSRNSSDYLVTLAEIFC